MDQKRQSIQRRFRNSHARERLHLAVEHLATSDHKLKESVLDAYRDHLSFLLPTEFPNQKTRRTFEAIETQVKAVMEKIEQKPGAYELHLHNELLTPLEVAKRTLDYRIARKRAKLMTNLYFDIEAGIVEEYERELEASSALDRCSSS